MQVLSKTANIPMCAARLSASHRPPHTMQIWAQDRARFPFKRLNAVTEPLQFRLHFETPSQPFDALRSGENIAQC
jgi:hypothetical protein